MTTPVPDEFKDLPGISDVEIKEMIEEGKVDIKNRVVLGIAIRTLHRAIFQGIPVRVESSFIGGDLDFSSGQPVSLGEVGGMEDERIEALKGMGLEKAVVINAPIEFVRTKINGHVNAIDANWDKVCVFAKSVSFRIVELAGGVNFACSTFNEVTRFDDSTFFEIADFMRTSFNNVAVFRGVNFHGRVNFGESSLERALFSQAEFSEAADFSMAEFNEDVAFGGARFHEWADFQSAEFGKAGFQSVVFMKEVYFHNAIFSEGCSFDSAELNGRGNFFSTFFGGEASFFNVKFREHPEFVWTTFSEKVVFNKSVFSSGVTFKGAREGRNPKTGFLFGEKKVFDENLDFRLVAMERPDGVLFQHVNLEKASFLETPLDKVQFVDVEDLWPRHPKERRKCIYDEIVPEPEGEEKNYPLIAQLYRQLKKNYEEARDYPGAGDFHYGEMEMTRMQQWKESKYFSWFLTWVYKLLSGYGERPGLALAWVVGILLIPAFCYHGFGITLNRPTGWFFPRSFTDSLIQSLGYMTFRVSETPVEGWAKVLMVLQALFGPVQLALTALALRRRFRR